MPEAFALTVADTASPALVVADSALAADLRTVADLLAGELLATARARASGDVVAVRSGDYLASLSAAVETDGLATVAGIVSSSDPHAAVLEYGATLPPHEILPDVAAALRLDLPGVGQVFANAFAAHVFDPGGTIAARHVLGGALEAETPAIAAAFDAVAARYVDRAGS